MTYNTRDHTHCFASDNPPCGIKGQHRCCLCNEPAPTHSTREVEEILNNNRKETLYDSDEANEIAGDAINNFIIAALPELAEHIHHQLQKARHDWLREEIVTLKAMNDEFYSEREWPASVNMNDGYELALQTIIDSYLLELESIAQN